MLSAIRNHDRKKVLAGLEIKSNRPFSCPVCKDTVILRKGPLKIAHFAHKPPVLCKYGSGESESHMRAKIEIYESLIKSPHVTKCEMERYLETIRPDISCYINGTPVAIEVQISKLSLEEIIYRTIEYGRKGIYVLWLPLFTDKLRAERYSPALWEKWLHTTYYGTVYYWRNGLNIVPVHFAKHEIFVPHSTWFDSNGDEKSAGGYSKESKRYKNPKVGRPLNLVTRFGKLEREPTITGNYTVPECKLFVESQTTHWLEKQSSRGIESIDREVYRILRKKGYL